jgi:hypothetical protein
MTSIGTLLSIFLLTTGRADAAPGYDEDSADYTSYDSIVDDLQKQTAKQPAATTSRTSARKGWFSASPAASGDPFENVWIHAGVGFAQTTQNLTLPNGVQSYMAGHGVQAALGIDILGPNLSAEGTVRTFGESEDSSSKISLKEFDLKILFKARHSSFGFRAGGGLSARYMTVRSGLDTYDVTTPASVLTLGGDIYLTPAVSLGLDLSTRNAMISDTFDKSSYDGTIRVDTHF